ncbi:GNAT family N-acetyltransferase [Nodosilinea sp. FACHB-13]|uniref:GNAT family N-acetyltransferase n=1 Tax=Cyanophyceae TaxID=3028117 RepID=UPI001F54A2D9|nr:GNAT family N-acetyltransferase [Nodosilinea sp. FACHB-13]
MTQLNNLHIRPALPTDKPTILNFCQHTWNNETDYIASVWDLWSADLSGHILVADFNGQPIGMTRLVQLSTTEGWWEALRVDRAYRRQGIGTKLINAALDLSHSLGLTTVRACVSVANTSMHPLMNQQGFKPLGNHAVYSAEATDSAPTALKQLRPQDCERVWATINRFALEEGDRLFVVRGAKWQSLTPEILAQQLKQGWVWGVSNGDDLVSLFIRSQMENPDGTFWIGWLGGTQTGLSLALEDLCSLAYELKFQSVGGFLPQSNSLLPLAKAVGYQIFETSTYRIYAKSLDET